MSTPNNHYELFNFTDPLEEAFETVIEAAIPDADVQMPRGTGAFNDIAFRIRFADGEATGHKARVELGQEADTAIKPHWVYDLFRGGIVEIQIDRHRWDAETIADNQPAADTADTTSRDVLSLLAGRVRYALRRTDAADLNAALLSPKISHIRPLGMVRNYDSETGIDSMVLRYEINYGIPDSIWPQVVLSEEGFLINEELSGPGDLGEALTAE